MVAQDASSRPRTPGGPRGRPIGTAFRSGYRLIRWGLALLGIGAIVGTLALIGQNPVGWAVNNWNDLVGKTTQVQNLDAYTEPQPGSGAGTTTAGGSTPSSPNSSAPASSAAKPPVDTAQNVLDNLSDTAWTVIWSQGLNQQPSVGRLRLAATGRRVRRSCWFRRVR